MEGGRIASESRDGEYILLYGDEGTNYFRGHVTLEEAKQGWKKSGMGFGKPLEANMVIHTYARWVPSHYDEYEMNFIVCGQGRGAFPVTEVW